MQNLRLAAGVKNVFNHEYFTRSPDNNSGMYVGMPRTFFVQGGMDF
ncbi:TonB-dependent receptor [Neisseriaceae bacterium JH1-16]|nr:TonB-dependent receptor [Neisseriaceae bacterium JH1-16]